jgi:type IV pilus assembly protein PilM
MFNFVQSWFASGARPIGVDFGTDCLRIAQIQFDGGEARLIAAASADVPTSLRGDFTGRARFFTARMRELLASGNFRGRQILLGLPASLTSIANIRLPGGERAQPETAVTTEVCRLGQIDPRESLVRQFRVGETSANVASREVIAIWAPRLEVNRLIAAAAEARLEVVGMNLEPRVIFDCFSHVYRRGSDLASTSCLIDIGTSATRLVVVHRGKILRAGAIAIGGDHFAQAVAGATLASFEDAKLQRLKLSHAQMHREAHADKRQLHVATPQGHMPNVEGQREMINAACSAVRQDLVRQLRRFHADLLEAFPINPIERLIFVGGEGQNRDLCRSIAQSMGLSAQIGDPLLRLSRIANVAVESGIDRREPQPAWTVAIGLSLGPATRAGGDSRSRGQTSNSVECTR